MFIDVHALLEVTAPGLGLGVTTTVAVGSMSVEGTTDVGPMSGGQVTPASSKWTQL